MGARAAPLAANALDEGWLLRASARMARHPAPRRAARRGLAKAKASSSPHWGLLPPVPRGLLLACPSRGHFCERAAFAGKPMTQRRSPTSVPQRRRVGHPISAPKPL